MDTGMCGVCEGKSVFVIEWYGVNQHGENAEVVYEVGSCASSSHLLENSREGSDRLGSLDGIFDVRDRDVLEDIELPGLAPMLNNGRLFDSESFEYQLVLRSIYGYVGELYGQGRLF